MAEGMFRETKKERRRAQLVAFVGFLLTAPTVAEAAAKSGVSSRTATRWLKSPEFARAYVETRQATMQNLTAMLRASSIGAAEALGAVLKDDDAASTAKVAAAKCILDSLVKLSEAVDHETRLAALESLAGAK